MKAPYLGKERRRERNTTYFTDLALVGVCGFILGALVAAWFWGGM